PATFPADQGPVALAAGAVNGDVNTDLVSSAFAAGDVSVPRNAGDGLLSPGGGSADATIFGAAGRERPLPPGPTSIAGPAPPAPLPGPDDSAPGVIAGGRPVAAGPSADDAPASARRHARAVDAAFADPFQPAV